MVLVRDDHIQVRHIHGLFFYGIELRLDQVDLIIRYSLLHHGDHGITVYAVCKDVQFVHSFLTVEVDKFSVVDLPTQIHEQCSYDQKHDLYQDNDPGLQIQFHKKTSVQVPSMAAFICLIKIE